MGETYKIIRFYFNDFPKEIIRIGLTLEEAQEHCNDSETSSKTCVLRENLDRTAKYGPWFDGYESE